RPEAAGDRVRDRAVDERHPDHLLLRLVDALADRLGDLVRLAEPEAHAATAVADDDQGAEAEPPSALHHLGNAVDVDDLLLQLDALRVEDDATRTARRTRMRQGRSSLRARGRPRAPPRRRRARGHG